MYQVEVTINPRKNVSSQQSILIKHKWSEFLEHLYVSLKVTLPWGISDEESNKVNNEI